MASSSPLRRTLQLLGHQVVDDSSLSLLTFIQDIFRFRTTVIKWQNNIMYSCCWATCFSAIAPSSTPTHNKRSSHPLTFSNSRRLTGGVALCSVYLHYGAGLHEASASILQALGERIVSHQQLVIDTEDINMPIDLLQQSGWLTRLGLRQIVHNVNQPSFVTRGETGADVHFVR